MSMSAIFTYKKTASQAAHAARDEAVRAHDELIRQSKPGDEPVLNIEEIRTSVTDARSGVPAAEKELRKAAAKVGLSLVGAPDVSFGVHGGREGPIEIWYQARAK